LKDRRFGFSVGGQPLGRNHAGADRAARVDEPPRQFQQLIGHGRLGASQLAQQMRGLLIDVGVDAAPMLLDQRCLEKRSFQAGLKGTIVSRVNLRRQHGVVEDRLIDVDGVSDLACVTEELAVGESVRHFVVGRRGHRRE
jgi:hypothetical protein